MSHNYNQLHDQNQVGEENNEQNYNYPEESLIKDDNQLQQMDVKQIGQKQNNSYNDNQKQNSNFENNLTNISSDGFYGSYQAPQFQNFDVENNLASNDGPKIVKISGAKLIDINLFKKTAFTQDFIPQLQKMNPTIGPLQIMTDRRVQNIKQSFLKIRKINSGILLSDFTLYLFLLIALFGQFGSFNWFAQCLIVITNLVWPIQILLVFWGTYKFRVQFMKIAFLYTASVLLAYFIIFLLVVSPASGFTVFLLIMNLILQIAILYGIFISIRQSENCLTQVL